jgi:hypothetical protein
MYPSGKDGSEKRSSFYLSDWCKGHDDGPLMKHDIFHTDHTFIYSNTSEITVANY